MDVSLSAIKPKNLEWLMDAFSKLLTIKESIRQVVRKVCTSKLLAISVVCLATVR